ncbi:ATPase [Roseivivax marinus]|uniref:BadF/BadG/BcrA/BcrD ATPase family protein n=1 Tax=Roseivivax marinus TaxID=1379903 RepID=UPI001F036A0D|nr:BadF/BadG/BcrA/BcrD ATPase family protein [Roseivivax marinus]UMA65303.1 ATPase [Roseivivax marinus]
MIPGERVIAVDGGGSGSRFLCDGPAGRVTVELGPANVYTDFDGALRVLRDGLGQLARDVGADLTFTPACLALAGVIDAGIADRVRRALPLRHARIEEDWRAALEGALDGRDGAVVGLGTGSFAARKSGDAARAVGGHGLRLGDEASGAWLGRSALSRALHAAEGLADASPLTDVLLDRHGGVAGIVGFARDAAPADFAALAPEIAAAAGGDDPHAVALLREGAGYMRRALSALRWAPSEPLSLIGGLGAAYLDWLPQDMAAAHVPPAGTALDGALRLAHEFRGQR